ncbi:MAG: type II toxin-antitoxin system HicB family antitoxin [Syntrophobacteraceae bacterium]
MKDMMKYKDYYGSVHYSDEDRLFFGKVEFVRALISYEGTDVQSLRQAFEEAVDDYLETCKEEGITIEKPFKGSFNIRVGADLHQRVAMAAAQKGISLNKYIADVLDRETAR